MLRILSNSKFLIPAMAILAIFAAGSGFYISLKQSQNQQNSALGSSQSIEGLFWPNPKQIHEFNTLDQTGNSFGLEQMQGKWSFVFFGYTHCPDVCPITMSVMNESYKQLNIKHSDLQIIFVSVDPERDTTEKLAQYVTYFNDDFIGLGGNTEMVDSLTKQIGAAYFLNNEEQKENYLVDHSASIFIFDPKARMVGKLSAPHDSAKITAQFIKIKDFINAQY
ncbi:MAG: SCO family protein [Proteobacteria bacterium]|nr:SCO family protein [Pseudomonadota bacterium]NOG59514.1 SCO family protein [Pseudomonadota bacterium]